MTLRDLLRKNNSAILGRWQERALAAYASDTRAFFKGQKDRFANPVGHALREGTEVILRNLQDEMNAEEVCGHLEQIVKIRAIQGLPPSQAVSFVLELKGAIRQELGSELKGGGMAVELAEIDAQIDQITLFAFDIYTRCREKVSELRINEVKRSVAAVMGRLGVEADEPETGVPGPGDDGQDLGGGR